MTDQPLFTGFELPGPEKTEQLSADQRRTIRQQQDVVNGRHPLTKGLLHPEASTQRSAASGSKDPFSCGTCVFRELHSHGNRSYPKCSRFPAFQTHSAATDVRAWWPACTGYLPNPTANTQL